MLKNKYFQIGIVAVIMIIAIIFVVNDFYFYDTPSKNIDNDTKAIINTSNGQVTIEGDGDYKIEQVPINDTEQGLIYPNLNHTLVFQDSFSEDARVIIQNNVAELRKQLKVNPTSFENWMDLANQYKIIDDYEYARDIWEFLNKVSPENTISFYNLGNLYHYYLKDYPKSEENFRKAIKNNKNNTQAYIAFHELYKYSYKQDTTLAIDVLLEGIENVVNNIDLLITLATYYKEKANLQDDSDEKSVQFRDKAQKYYTQARDEAQKLGNIQLVEMLETELSEVKARP